MADRYPAAATMLRCRIKSLITDIADMDNRIRGNILDPRIRLLQDSVDAKRDFLSGYVQCLYDWEHIDVEELSDLKHDLQVSSLEKYLVIYRGGKSRKDVLGMRLYKILGSAAVFGGIIGLAGLCGAIECRTSLLWPGLILLASVVCGYAAYSESGGYFEYDEFDE